VINNTYPDDDMELCTCNFLVLYVKCFVLVLDFVKSNDSVKLLVIPDY